jgi:hypothetical protein
MLDRIRWSFQNNPLLLPSAPSLIAALLPTSCNRQPRQPSTNPIFGGQCVGSLYTVVFDRFRPNGQVDTNVSIVNIPGPITNFFVEWRRQGVNNQKFAFIVIGAPNSTEPSTPGRVEFGPSSYIDEGEATKAVLKSITRQGGQPDNCGDGNPPPLPPITEPPPGTLPDITITLGGTSVVFSPTFNFQPAVNIGINGGLHIPINVRLAPNLVFPTGIRFPILFRLPDLRVNIPVSLNFIQNNVNSTTGGGGISFTERLIGVNITSTVQPGSPITIITGTGGAPSLYVPRLATVRFVPPSFVSNRQSVDIDVKTLSQFVPVPWSYGAASFSVLPNVGVSVSSTPVLAQVANLVVASV